MVDEHITPSDSAISRWRLLLDVAAMLQTRAARNRCWARRETFTRWMMVDSSPQGGRDYELLLVCSAVTQDLPHAVTLTDAMYNLCSDRDSCENLDKFYEAQESLQSQLKTILVVERPPPVTLGSGKTALPDKFAATVHALYLETGSAEALVRFSSEVVACTSDLGTEFNIVRVNGASPYELLPWLSRPALQSEDDWPCPEEAVRFNNALAIPGVLHVLHNAAKRMLNDVKHLNEAIDSLASVADLLRKKHSMERLCQRCFSSPVGRQLQAQIRAFDGKVHRSRWGSVAFCTEKVLALERPLRWGWSLEAYMAGSAADRQGDDGFSVNARVVDEAVRSEHWWQCLKVLDKLHGAVRHLFAWCEGCPCHGDVGGDNPDFGDPKWQRLKNECPMRGRRCPEIACGGLLHQLRSKLDVSAAELVLSMSGSVSQEEQGVLLGEFEQGRAALLFNLSLKTTAMCLPPLLVFGVGHVDPHHARDALRRCLESDNDEGLMQELKSPCLLAEAREFLDGQHLANLDRLAAFVGKVRFASCVERAIEGEHAGIHQSIRKAPHHSVAYVSLKRRLPDLKIRLRDPEFFQELSLLLQAARNPKLAVQALGMGDHRSCGLATSNWDPIFGKLVYRADPVTTHAASVPVQVEGNVPPDRNQREEAQAVLAHAASHPNVDMAPNPAGSCYAEAPRSSYRAFQSDD